MGKEMSRDMVKDKILELQNEIGYDVSITRAMLVERELYYPLLKYWNGITEFKDEFNLPKKQTFDGKKYTKEELISIMKNFEKEYGFFPESKWIEKHSKEYGLPNRKTFNNIIGSWYLVKQLCGHDIGNRVIVQNKWHPECYDKDFLINLIYDYINKYNKNPTLKSISEYYGHDLKKPYGKIFGSWRDCLDYLGLPQNSVDHYTDEELEKAFLDFVEEYKRVPTIQDFNKTGRPSFWCYQNRFGSWAEACMHYGFKPNNREQEYYFDDGERCDSSFEYDISIWLRSNGITYERNIPYKEIDVEYTGKMNCDYGFFLENGDIWYVEAAGFIPSLNFEDLRKNSEDEIMYWRKLKYKIKLLERNNCNYKIIFPKELKENKIEDVFSFLFMKGSD